MIGYQITASNGDVHLVLVNADTKARDFALGTDLERFRKADVSSGWGTRRCAPFEWIQRNLLDRNRTSTGCFDSNCFAFVD